MKHVYDVEYEVYSRDARSRGGCWDWNKHISIVANGNIHLALRRAERVILSEKVKPEKDKQSGKVYCYRPVRVRVTKIEQVREVAGEMR
jgi:hypothetical protein